MFKLADLNKTEWITRSAGTIIDASGVHVDGFAQALIGYLRPGIRHEIKVSSKSETGCSVLIDGKKYNIAPGDQELTRVSKVERPVKLRIEGKAHIAVSIYTEETGLTDIPAGMIALDLSVPRAGKNQFILGKSRLGRDSLTYQLPDPDAFIVSESRLGEKILNPEPLNYWWRTVSDPATSIDFRRGVIYDGLQIKAETGTLTATIFNDLDPRKLGAVWGTPIRCYNWQTRTPLFNGMITNTSVTPAKNGTYQVTIEAADQVATLGAIMRYGCVNAKIQTWQQRANDLLGKHNLAWSEIPTTNPVTYDLVPTVYESTLVSHLDLLMASQQGAWWISKHDELCLCPGLPSAPPAYTLTDTYNTKAKNCLYYTEAEAGFNSSELVTAVEITAVGASINEEGQWQSDEQTLEAVDNLTLATTYGRRLAQVSANISPQDAEQLARSYAYSQEPKNLLTTATLNALDNLDAANTLEVMQPVATEIRGEKARAYIGSIRNLISPYNWTQELELIPGKERN